jgi:hypothetical protein
VTRDAAELLARFSALSEVALLRVLQRAAQAGQPAAVDAVMEEFARRGIESDPRVALAMTGIRRCDDFWHTVTSFRTARCPTCASSSSEVWLRTAETRSRKFRPRRERAKRPPKDAEGESVTEFLWDLLTDDDDG